MNKMLDSMKRKPSGTCSYTAYDDASNACAGIQEDHHRTVRPKMPAQ